MSDAVTYDEITVGHSFEGPKIDVTREMIKEFAMASFDNNRFTGTTSSSRRRRLPVTRNSTRSLVTA